MKIDIAQLEFIDINLRTILLWIEGRTGLELTITSLYRIGDSGVHGQLPLRGCDVRMRNPVIGDNYSEMINTYWKYDPSRPELKCALLHDSGSGLHLHVQVHPNTVKG
jgi:hypothetical protein